MLKDLPCLNQVIYLDLKVVRMQSPSAQNIHLRGLKPVGGGGGSQICLLSWQWVPEFCETIGYFFDLRLMSNLH